MAKEAQNITVQNREVTSLRINWRSVTAEANGLPAVSIVIAALVIIFIVLLWWSGSLHFTF